MQQCAQNAQAQKLIDSVVALLCNHRSAFNRCPEQKVIPKGCRTTYFNVNGLQLHWAGRNDDAALCVWYSHTLKLLLCAAGPADLGCSDHSGRACP